MSIQRNLNDGNVKDILRRLYRLERQSMLAHSAIGREGLEVYDGGWIRILNGGLQVIGTATISGVLDVTGTFNASGDNNMSGTNNLSGENHLTGPTDVAGNFEIIAGGQFKAGDSLIYPDGSAKFGALGIASDGTMDAGLFELRPDGSADFGDLHIDASGKLTSGQFELNPDGSAKFGQTTVDTEGRITSGNIQIDPTNAGVIKVGSTQIQEFTGGGMMLYSNGVIRLAGLVETLSSITLLGAPSAPSGSTANVWMDSAGKLHRI